ncbi:intimin [Citrobacter koseri]|nr:intimin [Citrobacter koseri]STT23458.1 invasin [Citrobacter koseri]
MDINYPLGGPWRTQVDPAAVVAMRSLTGSRYDLVERNNNIVLEYRKKETLRLHTADLITGHAGEQKSLGVSVTSTYGMSRIDWDAQALSAAGGKVVQNGADYAVVLPAYQPAEQSVDTYTVSGVAVDTKGNRSDRSDTQVTVQALR